MCLLEDPHLGDSSFPEVGTWVSRQPGELSCTLSIGVSVGHSATLASSLPLPLPGFLCPEPIAGDWMPCLNLPGACGGRQAVLAPKVGFHEAGLSVENRKATRVGLVRC